MPELGDGWVRKLSSRGKRMDRVILDEIQPDLIGGAMAQVSTPMKQERDLYRLLAPPAARPDPAAIQAEIERELKGKNTRSEQKLAIMQLLQRYGLVGVIPEAQIERLLDEAGAPDVKSPEQQRIDAYVDLAQRHERGEMDDDAYARALSLLLP